MPHLGLPKNTTFPKHFPVSSLVGHTLQVNSLDEADPELIGVTLDDHIYTQYTLFGRRTTVYKARSSRHKGLNFVGKLSYQVATRRSEVTLVEKAKSAGVEHLPEFVGYKDLWKMSEGMRDLFEKECKVDYEDRVLRFILGRLYQPVQVAIFERPETLNDLACQLVTCTLCLSMNMIPGIR